MPKNGVPDNVTYTETARATLRAAEEEARGANHTYLGQEHLLLALARADGSLALRVLTALDVDPERLRATVTTLVPPTVVPPTVAELPRAPSLDEALRLAADEAAAFEHPAVGTDHLLLGVLRERAGIGHTALDLLGVTLRDARDQTLGLRAAGESEA